MLDSHDLTSAIAWETAQYIDYFDDLDARLYHPQRTIFRRRWVILVTQYWESYVDQTYRLEYWLWFYELQCRRSYAGLCQ